MTDSIAISEGIDQRRATTFGIIIGLIAVTFLSFYGVWRNEFINYDDNTYVFLNPDVIRGLDWQTIQWASTHVDACHWVPLTWISHALDCQLFGLNPSGHHITSLVLHISSVVLLFLALKLFTGSVWRSAMVAVLFGVHPLRVESVAWVAERKDVLSGLFFMLTLYFYARYIKGVGASSSKNYHRLAVLFFACGLLSKPMLVTLPFLLLLLDFWPLQRIDWSEPQKRWDSMVALLKEKIPFFVLTIVVSYITYSAQESRMAGTQAPAGVAVTIRLANAVVACVGYLKQTFIPINLCVHYPIKTIEQIGAVNLIAALFLLAVITGLVVKFWREQPVLTMGWFWFLGLLVPVSGIVQAGNMIQADRFTYLPGIGLMICLVWGLSAVATRMLVMKGLVIAVVCAVIGTMVVLSQHQIKSWHDTESVFNQVVKVFPDNHVALASLAEIDLQKGKIQDAQAKVDRVLKIEPGYPRGECMQATLLQMQGKMKEAIPHLERSIGPEVEIAAQARLVLSYLDGGRLAEADAGIERLLNVVPRDPALWLMKAAILKEQGQVAEALEIFKKVTAVYPDPPADTSTMYYSLAELFGIAGESKKAAVYYAKALEITPQSVGVLNDFAWLLATSPLDDVRNGSLAVQYAERACELSRWNQPVAMGTLAAAYAESGRFEAALKMAERARDKANAQGASAIAQRNSELLELYRANKPYREQSL